SSRSSCPVWSPSSTTIVSSFTAAKRRSFRVEFRLGSCLGTRSGGEFGAENSAGLRQLRERGRRVAGRGAARDLFGRPPRPEGGRSLRRVRGQDARPGRCTPRAAPEGASLRIEHGKPS